MFIDGKQITSTANTMTSRYPYTAWELNEKSGCSPDNKWNTYRFWKASDYGNVWSSTELDISLVDHLDSTMANTDFPWTHIVTQKGKITPLWYNPLNPNETSTTQTDSNFVQFTFFSGRWNWGYPFPSLSIKYNKYHIDPYVFGDIDDCAEEDVDIPYAGWYYPPYQTFQAKREEDKAAYFSKYGYNAVMSFSYNEYYNKKDYEFFAVDWQSVYVKTGDKLAAIDGKVQLWAKNCLTVKADCSFEDQFFKIRVAPAVASSGTECYYPENPVIHQTHPLNTDANTYFATQDLEQSKDYELNTGYYINRGDIPNDKPIPMQVLYTILMQIVYTGNYPLN